MTLARPTLRALLHLGGRGASTCWAAPLPSLRASLSLSAVVSGKEYPEHQHQGGGGNASQPIQPGSGGGQGQGPAQGTFDDGDAHAELAPLQAEVAKLKEALATVEKRAAFAEAEARRLGGLNTFQAGGSAFAKASLWPLSFSPFFQAGAVAKGGMVLGKIESALHEAATQGDKEYVSLRKANELIEKSQIEPSRLAPFLSTWGDAYWALSKATWLGFVPLVRCMAESGALDLGATMGGLTPLHRAVSADDIDIVRVLLAAGAPLEAESHCETGRTALMSAAQSSTCDQEILRALLAAGANADVQLADGSTPLHMAVLCGDPATVGLLIDAGAKLDVPDRMGETALHASVRLGKADLVKRLVAAGASFTHTVPLTGFNPLHTAVYKGLIHVVRVLVDAGAPLDAKAYGSIQAQGYGDTALHLAVREAYPGAAIVRLLVAAGADLSAENAAGELPSEVSKGHNASEAAFKECVDFLKEKLDLEAQDGDI